MRASRYGQIRRKMRTEFACWDVVEDHRLTHEEPHRGCVCRAALSQLVAAVVESGPCASWLSVLLHAGETLIRL